MEVCKQNLVSGAVLFLDVTTAFARMLRRSVFNIQDGDESWLRVLSNAGFSPADIVAIRDTVASLASWSVDKRATFSQMTRTFVSCMLCLLSIGLLGRG